MNFSGFRDTTLLGRQFEVFTDRCGGSPTDLMRELTNRFGKTQFLVSANKSKKIYKMFSEVTIPHKISVYEAGIDILAEVKINDNFDFDEEVFKRNLFLHDLSKFTSVEGIGYACYNRKTNGGKVDFELAWHHHKMNNPHHPEYWLNPNRSGELEVLPMPGIYILEMVADWVGGSIYGKSAEDWIQDNLHTFNFHPETRMRVENIVTQLGYLKE